MSGELTPIEAWAAVVIAQAEQFTTIAAAERTLAKARVDLDEETR